VVYLVLAVWALLSVFPLYWMVSGALSTSASAVGAPTWFPWPPILDNFARILRHSLVPRWFLNSVLVASVITAGSLLFNSMAAYAFAKLRFPGRQQVFWVLLSMLMVPGIVILIPLWTIFVDWGWMNTYRVLIVPHLASVGGMFLLKQSMQTLPSTLIDAARIDAASEWKIYWRIILPLARPALIVLAIFTFVGEWNSFLWWLLFTNSSTMRNVQVGLATFRYEYNTDYGAILAGALLAALPVAILFFSFQRFFQRGLTIGALKG